MGPRTGSERGDRMREDSCGPKGGNKFWEQGLLSIIPKHSNLEDDWHPESLGLKQTIKECDLVKEHSEDYSPTVLEGLEVLRFPSSPSTLSFLGHSRCSDASDPPGKMFTTSFKLAFCNSSYNWHTQIKTHYKAILLKEHGNKGKISKRAQIIWKWFHM